MPQDASETPQAVPKTAPRRLLAILVSPYLDLIASVPRFWCLQTLIFGRLFEAQPNKDHQEPPIGPITIDYIEIFILVSGGFGGQTPQLEYNHARALARALILV